MKQHSDIDRVLQVWMADGPAAIPDRVVDVVAARIGVQRQRRAWPFQGRTTVTPIKLIAALAAALVVAVVGYNLLPKGSVGGQATPPPTAAQTTAPTTAPASSPIPILDGPLPEGRYQMGAFDGLSIVADIPAGWVGDRTPYLTSGEGFDEEQILITFMLTDGLYGDACEWDLDGTGKSSQPGDVEVGRSVDDLVDALRANTSYTSSTPSPVTFGPYHGQELELQLPGDDVLSTCDIEAGDSSGSYYVFPRTGIYAQGPNNRWQLSIVDVGGNRLIILLSYFDGTPQADLEAARAIVESFELTPCAPTPCAEPGTD